MPAIKPSCVRDLKLRVNIADVVGRTVTLRKAGSRLKGLCPFHQEKTPSFHVNADEGFYKCFGCGKAGDIISFVRETEQLTFTEAVEALGQRFGVVIEYEEGAGPTQEDRSLRQELFDLHDQATAHYHETFRGPQPAGEFMRAYWTRDRRFDSALAEEFRIGAAPPDDSGLAARLWKRRYSEEALRQCGLFFIREGATLTAGTLRPRFRGRLMIPIRDHQGRVVAFTARQTALTPADDPAHEAKYVNSPETPIFTKGNLLFNLDRARAAAGDGHPFVLVEGQLDALRCWSVGLKTAVAPQGTAITDGQLNLLRRYHPQIECFFDSDSAGQKAALRLLPLALRSGLEVRFLRSPGEGKVDPDLLFLEKGLGGYEELRRHAQSAVEFACAAALAGRTAVSSEEKSKAVQVVVEIIAASEDSVLRTQLVMDTARALHMAHPPIEEALDRFLRRQRRAADPAPTGAADRGVQLPADFSIWPTEQALLFVCLHRGDIGRALSSALPHDWIDSVHPAGTLLNRLLGEYEQGHLVARDQLDGLAETPEEQSLVASLLFEAPRYDDPLKIVQEGLGKLRDRALLPRLREIELALAGGTEDSIIDPKSLLTEKLSLQRLLRQPVVLAVAG
jgi:DNA primase